MKEPTRPIERPNPETPRQERDQQPDEPDKDHDADERQRERQGNRGPDEMPGFGQGA
jgi:hypothetical protein